jgi:hypothetical protein
VTESTPSGNPGVTCPALSSVGVDMLPTPVTIPPWILSALFELSSPPLTVVEPAVCE